MAPSSPRVVLVGMPGSGKSTVGVLLARKLRAEFVDSDAEVERESGTSVPEIFARLGEDVFREREHRVISRLLATHDGVIALGGGAPLHPGTRAALRGVTVVHLDVSPEQAAVRLRHSTHRPLLRGGDLLGRLRELLDQRRGVYGEIATIVVPTDGLSHEQVVDEILRRLPHAAPAPTSVVRVEGAQPYDVVVGRNLREQVVTMLGPARRALIVHPPTLATRAALLAAAIGDSGREVVLHEVPDAEQAKTVQVAAALWDVLGRHRFGREDALVGFGGGATTDLAGFAAATWLRGVRVVQVPSTLLGMVDAAIGGKTGINTAAGKNLVGAFHPPAGVVCDLDLLATLPTEHLRAGFGEVVKCGFIADPEILRLLEAAPLDLQEGHVRVSPLMGELVQRSAAVKANVVGQDLREAGPREMLNYGHTLAHAIERAEEYRWRHGDAVAVGMVFAAELAHRAGMLDAGVVARHRRVLESLELPTTYQGASWEELHDAMRSDKKVRQDRLRFVVLTDVARPTILEGPSEADLRAAFGAVSDRQAVR